MGRLMTWQPLILSVDLFEYQKNEKHWDWNNGWVFLGIQKLLLYSVHYFCGLYLLNIILLRKNKILIYFDKLYYEISLVF